MPIHLPGLGHKHKPSSTSDAQVPPPAPHRQSTQSSVGSTSSNPPSILKRSNGNTGSSTTTNISDSPTTATEDSSLSRGLAKIVTLPRSDTTASSSTNTSHTPATSISESDQCPLPRSAPGHRFPFFTMTLSSTGTLSFIAMPVNMRSSVLEAVNQAWKRGISKITEIDYAPEAVKKAREEGRCDGGVWEITMKDTPWLPASQDKVSSKRILINLLTTFAAEGYNLVSSYRTSAKDSSKDTLSFLQGEPDPEPIFMAVAFHSSDRIWIIDAEADVGEAVEEGIRKFWDAGIRDARVRERHCREIRLKGNPWTSHKTNSLISSRIIHLAILKHITHMDRGYDFVGSVDMSDAEEGEMPVTFYRRRWGSQRAVWTTTD